MFIFTIYLQSRLEFNSFRNNIDSFFLFWTYSMASICYNITKFWISLHLLKKPNQNFGEFLHRHSRCSCRILFGICHIQGIENFSIVLREFFFCINSPSIYHIIGGDYWFKQTWKVMVKSEEHFCIAKQETVSFFCWG